MQDKEFLSTSASRNIDINPAPGKSLDPVVEDLMNTPKDIVAAAQKAAGITN